MIKENTNNQILEIIKKSKSKINNIEFADISEAFQLLNSTQILKFKELLFDKKTNISDTDFINSIEKSFTQHISNCPHCNSTKIIKFGKSKLNKQCYKCNECTKIFCSSANSPLKNTKKSILKWFKYMDCMCKNLSIRESAAIVGIHRNTSFYWRHKILNAIKNTLKDNLKGIIEMNEIKICDNFKGNHSKNLFSSMNRSSRKNGRTLYEKFIEKKICILCCKDRLEHILSQVTGYERSRYNNLVSILKNKIAKNSTICTNNNSAYIGVANKLKLKLYKMTYSNEIRKKIYHIQNVKIFGNGFLKFLKIFNGVATKYLNFYITWFKWTDLTKNFSNCFKTLSLFISVISSKMLLRNKDFKYINSLPE